MDEKKKESGGIATEVTENAVGKQAPVSESRQALGEQESKLLDALDEVLERRSGRYQPPRPEPEPAVTRIAKGVAKKGVGFISLGLILVFLGVVMICCLFSKEPDFYLPLKLSPVCAVLIGIEILCNHMVTRGHFKINYPSILFSALLVVGCCVISIAIGKNANKQKEIYTNRTIAAEIYDMSYRELRHDVDIESLEVEVDMNPSTVRVIKGPESLSTEDIVNIRVTFAGIIQTPKAFAANCKKIIDGYRFMGINVTNFYFENESSLHSFKLNVEGKYEQDYSESRLAEKVSHIYFDNMNYFEDLKDYVDDTSSGSR